MVNMKRSFVYPHYELLQVDLQAPLAVSGFGENNAAGGDSEERSYGDAF